MAETKKTKQKKNRDGAIVIPVKKVKTKSGRRPSEVLAGKPEVQPAEKVTELTPRQADELGQDLRIRDGRVLIKFPKFVHMIVMHDFEDVMEKHADEDIVISTDLLVDLANAHDEAETAVPWGHLVAAVLLGVVITVIVMQIL